MYINCVTHPLSSADIAFFHGKSATYVISRKTDIDCILTHVCNFDDMSKIGYSRPY